MSSTTYYENIQKYLFLYADLLEQSNGVGLTDKAVHAENLFAHILNIVFKWSLENANEDNIVQDSFDLHDINEKVYVQVTSNKSHRKKYDQTVTSFLALNQGRYGRLIVLFISRKVSSKISRKQQSGNTTIDLYDIPGLLRKILYKCKDPAELFEINMALQHTLHPVALAIPQSNPLVVKVAQIPLIAEKPKGLYIQRRELVEQVFNFIQAANGLLVGGPGFGKSFILEELKRHCFSAGIPCHIIKINEMVSGDDAEISEELRCNEDWFSALSQLSRPLGPVNRGVLIFDAFDTAKDERLKATFLKQIRRSINDLKGWHTLVSVRTYDAHKSAKLLELFPDADVRRDLLCRYIEIPELSEKELSDALKSFRYAPIIIEKLAPNLRKLLKTPYFLKIFESLHDVKGGSEVQNDVDSEAQLLSIFWRKNIVSSDANDVFLHRITKLLSQNETLVCDKSEILNESNIAIYAGLVSQGIIAETSITRQRISFTHNILLDYAISRYLLQDDPAKQVTYISSHEKQPFIFRQSFVYFYYELWRGDRQLFWQHYNVIAAKEQPLFRLFHQTILNFVLITVYQIPEDIQPLLQGDDENISGNHIRKALEAIRFISGQEVRAKDLILIETLSRRMHYSFLWEVGQFIERAIIHCRQNNDKKSLKKLSDASCNFLDYVLKERLTFFNKAFLDKNGGYRGIKNLCDTYEFNKSKSKALLLTVLQILKEEDFPITFFQTIAEEILTVFGNDRTLGLRLYRELYAHTEISDKKTQLVGSPIMSLLSNRKQDYGFVFHRLEENYGKMIELDYEKAMPLGLKIMIARARDMYSYLDKVSSPIKIGKMDTVLINGYYYFNENEEYGPFVHANAIFTHLENLAKSNPTSRLLKKNVIATLPHLKVGKFWGRMLKLLHSHPLSLKTISAQILSNPGIYQSEDTIYEAGELLKVAWSGFTEIQRSSIEMAIHGIDFPDSYYSRDSVNDMKIRMLSCIPHADLTLPESRAILKTSPCIENTPNPYRGPTMAEMRSPTKEDKIQHSGFDLQKPADATLYQLYEKVEFFNEHFSKDENAKITTQDYEELLPAVQVMFENSEKGAYWNDQLKYSCDLEVAKFASHVSSCENLNAKVKELINNIALTFLRSQVYISGTYHMGTTDKNWIDFYPNARTQSVRAIANIMLTDHDRALETYFLTLMDDPSKYVRLKAIGSLGYFWHNDKPSFWLKVRERITLEKDLLCLYQTLRAIHFDNVIESNLEEIRSICTIMVDRLKQESEGDRRDLWQIYTIIILKLLLRHDAAFALDLIIKNTNSKEFCRNLTFEITTIVDPHDPRNEDPEVNKGNQILFDTLIKITEGQFKSIKRKRLPSHEVSDEFEIIDHVIQHLYFVLSNGRGDNRGSETTEAEQRNFFEKIRPLIDYILSESARINTGFMIAHTGYYFMQLMNHLLYLDPEYILRSSATIVAYSAKNNFTYDSTTLKEIVKLTESIIADHKELLRDKQCFDSLVLILDLFISSGWQEALELTWRLKDAF